MVDYADACRHDPSHTHDRSLGLSSGSLGLLFSLSLGSSRLLGGSLDVLVLGSGRRLLGSLVGRSIGLGLAIGLALGGVAVGSGFLGRVIRLALLARRRVLCRVGLES